LRNESWNVSLELRRVASLLQVQAVGVQGHAAMLAAEHIGLRQTVDLNMPLDRHAGRRKRILMALLRAADRAWPGSLSVRPLSAR